MTTTVAMIAFKVLSPDEWSSLRSFCHRAWTPTLRQINAPTLLHVFGSVAFIQDQVEGQTGILQQRSTFDRVNSPSVSETINHGRKN
jgi:hypothetical protein